MTISSTATFIPAVTKGLDLKRNSASVSLCWINRNRVLRRDLKLKSRCAVYAQEYTASSATQDDDDESFGGENEPVYGMRLPNLSSEDKKYLDSAASDKEFMRRMVEIAHRMDQRRHVDTLTSGRQTPDQYVEGLSGKAKQDSTKNQSPPRPTNTPPPPIQSVPKFSNSNASPAPHTESASVEDIDSQIAELNRQLLDASDPERGSNNQTGTDERETNDISDLEAQVELLNENIEQIVSDSGEGTTNVDAKDTVEDDSGPDNLSDEDLEERMKDIRRKLAEASSQGTGVISNASKPSPPMTTEERNEKFDQADSLRRKIRAEMGAVDERPSDDTMKDDRASSLERQIAAVQKEMEKLKMEEDDDEESQGNIGDDLSGDWDDDDISSHSGEDVQLKGSRLLQELERKKTVSHDGDANDTEIDEPRYEGLEDTPGQMSADEKKKAFEMLRKQVMGENTERFYDDPYNTVLPEKRELPAEDEEGDEEGDVPSGDEEEFDSFGPIAGDRKQLVEELEVETKKYITESRRLLQEHEVKMNVLLSRLMLSFEE